jgi:hypothetical protein
MGINKTSEAVTRAAQGYSADVRYELEGVAGKILNHGLTGSLALAGITN